MRTFIMGIALFSIAISAQAQRNSPQPDPLLAAFAAKVPEQEGCRFEHPARRYTGGRTLEVLCQTNEQWEQLKESVGNSSAYSTFRVGTRIVDEVTYLVRQVERKTS